MTKEAKIRLAEMVLDFVEQFREEVDIPVRQIGTLNKRQGLNGFKVAEVGTPVFDLGTRYMIMLESLDGKRNVELTYYKEDFKNCIDFQNENKIM